MIKRAQNQGSRLNPIALFRCIFCNKAWQARILGGDDHEDHRITSPNPEVASQALPRRELPPPSSLAPPPSQDVGKPVAGATQARRAAAEPETAAKAKAVGARTAAPTAISTKAAEATATPPTAKTNTKSKISPTMSTKPAAPTPMMRKTQALAKEEKAEKKATKKIGTTKVVWKRAVSTKPRTALSTPTEAPRATRRDSSAARGASAVSGQWTGDLSSPKTSLEARAVPSHPADLHSPYLGRVVCVCVRWICFSSHSCV